MTRRRNTILLLGLAALAIAGATVYGFRDGIEAQWWIRVLRSNAEPLARRERAAERLGELRAAGAVAPLLELELEWLRAPSEEFGDGSAAGGMQVAVQPYVAPESPWITAVFAIGEDAVRPLLQFDDPDRAERHALVESVLCRIDVSSRVARPLIEALAATESRSLRRVVAYRLLDLGTVRREDVARIVQLAEADDAETRALGLRLARTLIEPAGRIAEVAVRLLGDPDAAVRAEAAFTLGQLGVPSGAIVERLEEIRESGGDAEALVAEQALARLGAAEHSMNDADDANHASDTEDTR